MFHTIAYSQNYTAAQTLAQLNAVADTVLTTRSNDFIVTDDFRLGLAYGLGSSTTELRFNWPTYIAYGYHQLYQFDYQGTTNPVPPDRPALIDYLSQPMVVPKDEQLDIQVSNAAPVGGELNYVLLWLFTPAHAFTIPNGIQRLSIRATFSFTPGAVSAWSGGQVLTFETTFRGGWYAVVGLDVKETTSVAARLIFPKGSPYNGRILRPGVLCRTAVANRAPERFMGRLGTYGTFHSFELPQIEILPGTTAAKSGVCVFDVVYLGDGPAPPAMS